MLGLRWAFAVLAIIICCGAVSADEKASLIYALHEPAVKSERPPLLVLLHGQGADELDLIGLWPQLPQNFLVISPRAPFQNASGGYRWYEGADKTGIETSEKDVRSLIGTALKRYSADPSNVFVAGFSQGAVLSYQLALSDPGRFRGAAILSGSLFRPAAFSGSTDRSHEAFFVAHGTADDRISFSAATSGKAALAKLGVPTEFHAYPGMGHQITDAETADLSAWLARASTR